MICHCGPCLAGPLTERAAHEPGAAVAADLPRLNEEEANAEGEARRQGDER